MSVASVEKNELTPQAVDAYLASLDDDKYTGSVQEEHQATIQHITEILANSDVFPAYVRAGLDGETSIARAALTFFVAGVALGKAIYGG